MPEASQLYGVARMLLSLGATVLVTKNIVTADQASKAVDTVMTTTTEVVTGIAALIPIAHMVYVYWQRKHTTRVADAAKIEGVAQVKVSDPSLASASAPKVVVQH